MVEVDDVDAALDRAHTLGASAIREDFEVQGLGDTSGRHRTAWMNDPGGNRIALVESVG